MFVNDDLLKSIFRLMKYWSSVGRISIFPGRSTDNISDDSLRGFGWEICEEGKIVE